MKKYFKFNIQALLILTFISVSWVNLNHEKWISKSVIEQDIINYYSYLPATFIRHDLSLSYAYNPSQLSPDERYWPNKTPSGNKVIKMTMGMSVSYLPFFLMAHCFAKIFHFNGDGFSSPYHFAILFSSVFYFLIGIWFLYKILIRFFDKRIALLSLFLITFGTNVFFYLTIGAGLSHIVELTLVSIFIYTSLNWKENQSLKNSFFLGLILGLITLVRPVDILVIIFFVGINFDFIRRNFFQNMKHFFMIAIITFIVFVPQLIYWKYISGNYFFNSYVGERFYFNKPHVFEALFGFRKGWLVYTPIMLFSLIGFFFMKNNISFLKFPILIFTSIFIYVVFCWWCWWYGGSFGQRVMIDIYPLLIFPFAAFIEFIFSKTKVIQNTFFALCTVFVLLNFFQTAQAKYNIIHYDSMTKENYFRILFTMTKQEDQEKYLLHPNYDKALRGEKED